MARGTGNKRGPRQTFQQQTRPPQPQQQFQPIMIPHGQQPSPGVPVRSPQQIMIQQVQMAPRMQQQQQPQQFYQQQQQQQQFVVPHMQQYRQVTNQQGQQIMMPVQMAPRVHHQQQQQQQQQQKMLQQQQQPQPQQIHPQQQQQLQLQHQQLQQQQPQIMQIGNKRYAQEPSNVIMTEQCLREPLISTLERNMSKHFFSHTLHRTFGLAIAQITQ